MQLGGTGGDQIFVWADLAVDGLFDLNGLGETFDGLAGSWTVDNTGVAAVTMGAGADNSTTRFDGTIQNTGGNLSLRREAQHDNDGSFLMTVNPNRNWVDFPASSHAGSGVLNYADGHSESRRWSDPSILRPKTFQDTSARPAISPFTDLIWLQERSRDN